MAPKGDVRKFYNAVLLEKEDCSIQYFLWRGMDANKPPDTFQVIVNNIGVKPAGAIANTSMYKSAYYFKDRFPENVRQLKNQSYEDDIGLTDSDDEKLEEKTKQADEVLYHANMKVKQWIVSGDNQNDVEVRSLTNCLTREKAEVERVLGIIWNQQKDSFKLSVRINLSPLKKKSTVGPDVTKEELMTNLLASITQRQ